MILESPKTLMVDLVSKDKLQLKTPVQFKFK